jgi:hypothetical protein
MYLRQQINFKKEYRKKVDAIFSVVFKFLNCNLTYKEEGKSKWLEKKADRIFGRKKRKCGP